VLLPLLVLLVWFWAVLWVRKLLKERNGKVRVEVLGKEILEVEARNEKQEEKQDQEITNS
jgi:hypothetical protein